MDLIIIGEDSLMAGCNCIEMCNDLERDKFNVMDGYSATVQSEDN